MPMFSLVLYFFMEYCLNSFRTHLPSNHSLEMKNNFHITPPESPPNPTGEDNRTHKHPI